MEHNALLILMLCGLDTLLSGLTDFDVVELGDVDSEDGDVKILLPLITTGWFNKSWIEWYRLSKMTCVV